MKTINAVKIQKGKLFTVEIYLDAIDGESRELINDITFRKIKRGNKKALVSTLKTLYNNYGFEKVITTIRLPKDISKKYNVELSTTPRGYKGYI